MTEPDLQFLARQNERIINDLAHMRDSLDVLTAMVLRLETSITTVITELRAMQRQINRMNDRIVKLESD
jgi:septal ring factor EnvC (AmiA/AmiB activator)